jgi:hypothetical protein
LLDYRMLFCSGCRGHVSRGGRAHIVSAFIYDGSDKPVSTLGQGLDELRLVGSVTQSLSDFKNVLSKDLWIDIGLCPQCIKNFVLRDYPSRVLDQVCEHVKGLGSDGYTISIAPQKVVGGIETERLE